MSEQTNTRINKIMQLVKSLSQAKTPDQVLRQFSENWKDLWHSDVGYISLSCRGLQEHQYRITRQFSPEQVLADKAMYNWRDSSDLPVHQGGLLGNIISKQQATLIRDLDIPQDPVLGDFFADIRSLIAVPLYDDGKIKNWAIEISRNNEQFSEELLEDMLLQGNLIGGTVRRAMMLQELVKAKSEIDREVKRIAQIQAALLPSEMPNVPGVSFATRYETYDQAGGDMYFAAELPDGRVGVMIGDVSGHGPAAAVVMAMVESLLSGYSGEHESTSHVMRFLNEQLYAKNIQQTFVTAFCGVFDPINMTFRYSRAGHPPPMLRSMGEPEDHCLLAAEHEIDRFSRNMLSQHCTLDHQEQGRIVIEHLDHAGGLPLGMFKNQNYEEAIIRMRPGQTLVLYTDGVTETRSPQGDFFGVQGVEAALHDCSGMVDCAVETIMSRVREHEAGLRPADDQTLLIMRINE